MRPLDALEKVNTLYEQALWSDEGSSALSYLMDDRRFSEETIRKFRVGYASAEVLDRMPEDGVSALGRIRHLTHDGKDRFTGRVTFPILDDLGRVRGFSARLLGTDSAADKYYNSPSSHVFKKKWFLYGLPFARQAIWESGNAVVCEGFTDAMAFHQTGTPIAVSAMGTYFTKEQLTLLGRYCRNIYLSFDADAAGDEATRKGLEMAHSMGFKVGNVGIPEGKDPDEFLLHGT